VADNKHGWKIHNVSVSKDRAKSLTKTKVSRGFGTTKKKITKLSNGKNIISMGKEKYSMTIQCFSL
jgi:hypothetical protein